MFRKQQRHDSKQIKQNSDGVSQGPSTSDSTHAKKYITFPFIRITLRHRAPFNQVAGEGHLKH